jgi:hypothetical protein
MVYKWTMVIQFSLEYCIDNKDHKSEEEIKEITVEGSMSIKSSKWMLCKAKEFT